MRKLQVSIAALGLEKLAFKAKMKAHYKGTF
jgi:hypothetical protein